MQESRSARPMRRPDDVSEWPCLIRPPALNSAIASADEFPRRRDDAQTRPSDIKLKARVRDREGSGQPAFDVSSGDCTRRSGQIAHGRKLPLLTPVLVSILTPFGSGKRSKLSFLELCLGHEFIAELDAVDSATAKSARIRRREGGEIY